MATENSNRIGQPAKAIHAGVNNVYITHTTTATFTAGGVINMMPIPPGARIADVKLNLNKDIEDTAIAVFSVEDSGGNAYISSATAGSSGDDEWARMDAASRAGYIYTASDNLRVVSYNSLGTGTSGIVVKMVVDYTVEDDPDQGG